MVRRYMRRGYNIEFQFNMIKTLLRYNYNFDERNIDLVSMIDTSLSPCENWGIIKERLML